MATEHSAKDPADDQRPGLAAGALQDRAAHGALWTLVHVAVSVPLAFAVNVLVARVLDVAEYGELAFLTLATSLLVIVTNLGVSDGIIQWGAAAWSARRQDEARELLRRSFGFHAFVQLPPLILGVFFLARSEPLWVVACLVVSVVVPSLLGTAALTISVENRSAASAKVAIASNLVTQAAVSVTAAITHSAGGVWAVRALVPSLMTPLNLRALNRSGRRNAFRLMKPVGFPDGFWRYNLFACAGGLVGMLVFQRSEIFVLRAVGAAEAVGIFALAAGVAAQITAPVDALVNPLRPAVAGIVESHPERVGASLLKITRVSGLFSTMVVTFVVPIIAWLIPVIYGSKFLEAGSIFLALGLVSCAQSALLPVLTFTNARKRGGFLFGANSIALALDLGLAVLLVPTLGLWGAVIANGVGQIAAMAPVALSECRLAAVPRWRYAAALAPLLTAIGVQGAVAALGTALSWPAWLSCAVAVTLGLATVRAVTWRFGLLPDDMEPLARNLPVPLRAPFLRVLKSTVAQRVET